tara:strand:+ start:132 stop:503 length:372 start_codon:yes stop_codon:yes gene_type:complete
MSTHIPYNKGVVNQKAFMPVKSTASATATPRKRRTRKTSTTATKSPATKRVNKTRTPKVAMTETPKAETLTLNVPEKAKVETKSVTKSLLKDYPRDGFALFLLPLLLLEAGTKELLKLAGTLK